ncbi:hypothetical protein Poli38472_007904 [Pythium oligandrum]|uniref:GPI mannosyltransferase 2 n=1 Tax=Pythium oligandrum TaxID=41045 RepID=A0A8K1CT17_PYTOL|nr:hypothetical protein Poli38472_007904 [Pythium oligandrum]|eukprot:TMW68232.1 hypothetical protein Poli38472_007904 [Pythium oligandrum]
MAERSIARFAVASRAVLSVLAACTALIVTPYDTSGRIISEHRVWNAFANWDGVYYTLIAQHGYDYENVHAFFPLYPLIVRFMSRLLPLDNATSTLVSGWFLSNASFVLAAVYLYRLGCLVLKEERTARRAAYLFCVAPSSIFMTAAYSESLMCLLSFAGMYYLESYRVHGRGWSLLGSAVLFGAASATRSNGALLSLFIAWYRLRASPHPFKNPARFLAYWFTTALLGVIAIGPQVIYFLQAIYVYCPSIAGSTGSPYLESDRPWCASAIPNISAIYMFVQREYWNVGLFRYYEWKQLPNFLLAAPILTLSFVSLGSFVLLPQQEHSAAPYYAHWAFLVVNALLVVHIQVTTRLLAACPPLFWAPAVFIKPSHVVVAYFLLYSVLGVGLFSSFYPWT